MAAKIVRYNGDLAAFASAAPGTERTIFGDVAQANDLTSQINADFLRGWGIVGPSDQPALEDFNGAMYTHGQLLAYLHQVGVPEYNATQEYHIGSITNLGGTLYKSKINTNIGNSPDTSAAQWQAIPEAAPPVTAKKGVRAYLSAANASVTISSDEVIVKSALGGAAFLLDSFSQSINISIVGAGGMNAGVAPVSGYVAIYAIYNPTTNTRSTLAVNATLAAQPEVCGVSMPAGFTASSLLGVWPTTAASILAIGLLRGRRFSRPNITVLSTAVGTGVFTTLSVASAIPLNAISCRGFINVTSAAGSNNNAFIASDSLGTGNQYTSQGPGTGLAGNWEIDLVTAQTIFYQMNVTAAPGLFIIQISSYEF